MALVQPETTPNQPTAITADIPLTRICGQRDAAIRTMDEAVALYEQARQRAQEALDLASHAAEGRTFNLVDRASAYQNLFQRFDLDASRNAFREHTDASIWLHLLDVCGIEDLMDAKAREEFFAELSASVPEVNEDNARATFEGLRGDANLIFQRGLARAFTSLDRRFKSHDAFKLGSRIILTNVFSDYGSLNYGHHGRVMADIERVLAILDGEEPNPGALAEAIKESRTGWGPQQSVAETPYLRIKGYCNGNAHLWFTRPDLTEKANQVLADYYGEVLPDAAPKEADAIKTKSGLPAKDLSFYPTPEPVVTRLLRDLYIPDGGRVLEPSAGTGHIAEALVRNGYAVDAIEIDAGRAQQLAGRLPGIKVLTGNFLQLPPRPVFDAVVMNPPFYGTHWMEHVVHAFDWLAPGGKLRTILPATAELGDSAKHKKFRTWAKKHSRYRDLRFSDLPPESFASSGTRINTLILELQK